MALIKKHAKNTADTNSNIQVTNIFSEEKVNLVLDEVQTKIGTESIEITYILITGVLQKGGSNAKAGNSVNFSFNNYSLSSHQLQNAIKKVVKNGTNRQLARTICDDIVDIALEFNIPGDLHAQMRMEYSDISDSEAVWCSNFQTTNPNCPERVRDWLVSNYRARFNK